MEVIALIVLVNKRNSILENYQIDLCLSCSWIVVSDIRCIVSVCVMHSLRDLEIWEIALEQNGKRQLHKVIDQGFEIYKPKVKQGLTIVVGTGKEGR